MSPMNSNRTQRKIFSIPGGSTDSLVDTGDVFHHPDRSTTHHGQDVSRDNVDCSPSHHQDTDHDTRPLNVHDTNHTRRYYALMELLETETGYLNDLRILVDVYLANLPTLSVLPRTRSSPAIHLPSRRQSVFCNTPEDSIRVGPTRSQSQSLFSSGQPRPPPLNPGTSPPPSSFPASFASPPTSGSTTGSSPLNYNATMLCQGPQPLLTKEQTHILRSNASSLLELHVHHVSALRRRLEGVGFLFDDSQFRNPGYGKGPDRGSGRAEDEFGANLRRLDDAVAAVCEQFIKQASEFNVYQSFCAGHTEALDLVRRVQQAHPAQWDKWEKKCAAEVAERLEHGLKSAHKGTDSLENFQSDEEREGLSRDRFLDPSRRRRHSTPVSPSVATLPQLEGPSAASSSSSSCACQSDTSADFPPSLLKHTQSDPTHTGRAAQARLTFLDYLIKPVQRICKYPLLLEQLRRVKVVRARRSREERARERSSGLTLAVPSHRHPKPCGPEIEPPSVGVMDGRVDRALRAMHRVALAVDEARRRKDIETKSGLIAARVAAHPRCPLPAPFVRSLGASLIAGSLDVVHSQLDGDNADTGGASPHSRGPVKVKYLGAFLYVGGYIVLVKVVKANVYEVKHWFPLAEFEVVNVEEEDALLPCSFRLETAGHYFELAAACEREKEIWISAIFESRQVRPHWVQEPPSSLLLDNHIHTWRNSQVSILVAEEPKVEMISTLPTVLSLDEAEAEGISAIPAMPAPPIPQLKPSRSSAKLRSLPRSSTPTSTLRAGVIVPTRQTQSSSIPRSNSNLNGILRSSSGRPPTTSSSVISIFSPASDDETILIRRCSASRRSQVDRFLLDVFSEPCLSARFHAQARGDELFRDPSVTPGSSLGMGIAAKNRLTRRESVLVPRQRSRSVLVDDNGSEADSSGSNLPRDTVPLSSSGMLIMRAKSLAGRRRNRESIRVKPMLPTLFTETEDSGDGRVVGPSPATLESSNPFPQLPRPLSNCSSVSTSRYQSDAAISPMEDKFPPAVRVVGVDATPCASDVPDIMAVEYRPKRTRSLVSNVRGLFVSRSTSPSSSQSHSTESSAAILVSAPPDLEEDNVPQPDQVYFLTRLWHRASLRRRVRSMPDAPAQPARLEPPGFLVAQPSAALLTVNSGLEHQIQPLSLPTSSMSELEMDMRKRHSSDSVHTRSPTLPGQESPARADAPQRRQSLFASGDKSLRRTFKNRLFFQNLGPLTPLPTNVPL